MGDVHRRRRRTRSARQGARLPGRRRRGAVPGHGRPDRGGYTYGDFGKIDGGARGPRRRRDLGRDAVGPARRAVGSERRRGDRHAGHAAVAARAVVPGRAQRDPRRRPPALPERRPQRAIWKVFAHRGMGSECVQPVEGPGGGRVRAAGAVSRASAGWAAPALESHAPGGAVPKPRARVRAVASASP